MRTGNVSEADYSSFPTDEWTERSRDRAVQRAASTAATLTHFEHFEPEINVNLMYEPFSPFVSKT